MRRRLLAPIACIVALLLVAAAFPATDRGSGLPARPGVTALLADGAPPLDIGIATFEDVPSEADTAALRALGLTVQPMRHLPLAIVRGSVDAMIEAVRTGAARDVYPNEKLSYFDERSAQSINATEVWEELGVTGAGVGVAILDTGVDATHPDLANRVTHNIKMVGPEHLGVLDPIDGTSQSDQTIVVPVDQGPYNNSDTSSGHGTHVAGIVAADGSATEDLKGVAPGADLIGYGAGDGLYIFTIVAAFDHMVEHREDWNIDVVNNSWGSSYALFDPANPINVATRATAEAGIVVVFAAGNSDEEMQINRYSVAPWVISVGSTDIRGNRSSFSSGGLIYDNSELVEEIPAAGHLRFEGDRIGLYHPDVAAPGSSIRSTVTPTGFGTASSRPPGGSASLSGTSMASPHVAGLVALLLEADPELTTEQVLQVMQVTARPFEDGSAFWQLGYGFVDARAAVELVRSAAFQADPDGVLAKLQAGADAEVQRLRAHRVVASDHIRFDALPVSVAGSDSRTFEFEVAQPIDAVRATMAFPATVGLLGSNTAHAWTATIADADGTVLGTTEVSRASGLSFGEFDASSATPGTWTVTVSGDFGLHDGVTLYGRQINVAIAQLVARG